MNKMNPVVHFEMPAGDGRRMAEFYSKAFGWQTKMMGPEMGNYITVATTGMDEQGRPKMAGAINGGFYPKNPEGPPQYPSLVIAVDNIVESMKRVADAGGKLLGEPVDIPGVGKYISFIDTEGNRSSILQPLMKAG
jgi:predicted enzyme related to lactoylglutathione lyase